ncbi:MAG: glycosyltransferase family 2 protein [Candidatus Hydrogenedens sp.]|nr:glycosyltransferase [Candidatus Hydrogenedentota bacterium]NLF59090.1 glycosyltransferase family 2 protein [Candidatus Hydrogenedens sp.]
MDEPGKREKSGDRAGDAVPFTPLPPARGLVFTRNRRGLPLSPTTLHKWARLLAKTNKARKIDCLCGPDDLPRVPGMLDACADAGLRLCLRVRPAAPPPEDLADWAARGLLDVFLSPSRPETDHTAAWMAAAERAGLPVRVRVAPSPTPVPEPAKFFAGCSLVLFGLSDPFDGEFPAKDREESAKTVRGINETVRALLAAGIPAGITDTPLCLLEEEARPAVLHGAQQLSDCRMCQEDMLELARRLFRLGPNRADKVVENLMARGTSVHNMIDAVLLPWIQDYPRLFFRTWMFHKITRHLPFLRRGPRPMPDTLEAWEAALAEYRAKTDRELGPVCAGCMWRRICGHDAGLVRRCLPGLEIAAAPGEAPADPNHFRHGQAFPPDAVDRARLETPAVWARLEEEAEHVAGREAPTREIGAEEYEIEGRYTHHMPGAVRWLSFTPGELRSTVLARVEPPFTLSFTVGGGIAGHAGFAFGRHAILVCPMVDYRHRITLHADAEGNYVLLRDGKAVRPAEFQDVHALPPRLAGVLEPRLSLHNIDGMILTQTVLLWEGARGAAKTEADIKYSVIIISTRYTRRLQAALLSLAHQRGMDMSRVEVVIGYVPGLDATDDLLDGMRDAFPALRIVRAPFDEGRARAKGFMINEAARVASGEWAVLMDADILAPPDTFARLEETPEDATFIAPDGRKMLSPEVTSRILLGEIRPWECHEALLETPGELRVHEADGIPIGFFQCVRREILERIRYHELDHFESSDWLFGHNATSLYGRETRLTGFHVLHLDHSGSQWYGTAKHR